jgi:osmotically inducible protein OsmC
MVTRTASARYEGMGKDGKGWISTQSKVLDDQRYGFGTRFGEEPGTNPEELIAAAHAGCFTMALSFALAKQGVTEGTLETTAKVTLEPDGDGFRISRSDLVLNADVPALDADALRQVAEAAKANCPVSRLMTAEVSLTIA